MKGRALKLALAVFAITSAMGLTGTGAQALAATAAPPSAASATAPGSPALCILLGQKFKGEKLAAPNHPHPHAPDSALAQKLVGPVAAFIDRMRDASRQRSA